MGVEKRRSTLSVLFYIKRQTLLKNGEALDRLMDKVSISNSWSRYGMSLLSAA